MKASVEKLTPEEYILAALSPEQRLEAAFRVAREAFRGTTLTVDDVEEAVRKVRRKRVAARGTKGASSLIPESSSPRSRSAGAAADAGGGAALG